MSAIAPRATDAPQERTYFRRNALIRLSENQRSCRPPWHWTHRLNWLSMNQHHAPWTIQTSDAWDGRFFGSEAGFTTAMLEESMSVSCIPLSASENLSSPPNRLSPFSLPLRTGTKRRKPVEPSRTFVWCRSDRCDVD